MSKPPRVPEQLPAAEVPGCPAAGYGRARSTYVRRRPGDTVLHRVVREHLETFLVEARLRGGGQGLPAFVEREFREFLSCGVLARGCARFRCTDCQREILVAFSCKGRGFCPSCCGRRMAELAAHLVDGVLGGLPVTPVGTGEVPDGSAGAAGALVPAAHPTAGAPAVPRPPPPRTGYVRPKYYAWASLLERTFAIDILACPDCGGRLRFVPTIGERALIEKILGHLGLPIDPPAAAPARQVAWLPGFEPAGEWLPDWGD